LDIDVSVIIAAYNVEDYVERAINSALASTGVSVQVIVVDDCSTDNTWDLLSDISHPSVLVYRLNNNGGPSVARNAALSYCTGTWVAVLDADDVFEANRLSRLITRAEQHGADLVVDDLILVNEERRNRDFMYNGFGDKTILTLADYIEGNCLGSRQPVLGYTKPLMLRSFIEKNRLRYNPEIRIGEDYIFMCEALASGARCVFEGTAGYLYSVREGSTSHRLKPQNILDMLSLDRHFLARYSLDESSKRAQAKRTRSLREYYAFSLLVVAIKSKDLTGACKAILESPTSPRHLYGAIAKRVSRLLGSR